jgi:uncharacterized low-complexity protein
MSKNIVKPTAFVFGAAFVGSVTLAQNVHAIAAFQLSPFVAPYAAAAEAKATEGKCSMQCDTNKDGKATKAEAMAAGWTSAQFDAADVKHQGFLTQADFEAYHLLNKSEPVKKAKEGSGSGS